MPQPSAGALILASDFGFAGQEGTYGGTYSVTTTVADLGLSMTFSTTAAAQYALVNGAFYVQCNTASAHNIIIYCNVDGSNDANNFAFLANTSQNGIRCVFSYIWRVALSGAGSHTIKFQAVTSTTNNDFSILSAVAVIVPCF